MRREESRNAEIFGSNTVMMELSSTEMGQFVIREVSEGWGKVKSSVLHISCLLHN